MHIFLSLLRREFLLLTRNKEIFFTLLLFFGLSLFLFPFALSSDASLLKSFGPGLLWVITIFTILSSVEPFYKKDNDNSLLSFYYSQKTPFIFVFFAKIITHFCLMISILAIILPLFGLFFGLELKSIAILSASLLLGMPPLITLIHFAIALTLSTQKTGMLVLVIVLPFIIPILIFGVGTVTFYETGQTLKQPFMFMSAIFLFVFAFVPWIAAYALKESAKQ